MAHSNTDDDKKNDVNSSAFTDPDVQSNYDADDFLYNSVPYGEYPEVTAETIHSKNAKTNFQYE